MLRVCHRNRSVFVCAARREKKGMRKNICKPFVKLWLIFVVFFSHWRVETKERTLLSNVWQRICNLNWWWKTTKKNSFEKKKPEPYTYNHIYNIYKSQAISIYVSSAIFHCEIKLLLLFSKKKLRLRQLFFVPFLTIDLIDCCTGTLLNKRTWTDFWRESRERERIPSKTKRKKNKNSNSNNTCTKWTLRIKWMEVCVEKAIHH